MRRRLVVAGLVAVVLASCSPDREASSPPSTYPLVENTTTSSVPNTPVVARVLSPERGSVQGSGGRGMVVLLSFTARDPSLLQAQFRLGGALPPPAAAVKPGHNPAFPGLVVTLSTTGTALGGPTANLANLFQIVSPSRQLDGSMQVSAVWTNTQADFGSDVDTTLAAYVISGTAPDTIPESQANLDVISNPVESTFRLGAATDGAPAASSTTTVPGATTTTAGGRRTTTTTRPGTTVAPVAPATTVTTRPATTTAPAPATTTTAPRVLGIF